MIFISRRGVEQERAGPLVSMQNGREQPPQLQEVQAFGFARAVDTPRDKFALFGGKG